MSYIRKLNKNNKLLLGVVGIVLLFVVSTSLAANDAEAPAVIDTSAVITDSLSEPDESIENAKSYSWAGEDKEPRLLEVPKYSISSFVQKMGNDQTNRIAVPTNIHLAGWYQNSILPGEDGITVIVGHVTGKESDGVFRNLGNLNAGDNVSITRGDGRKFTYGVVSSITVKENEAVNYIFSSQPGINKQLSLVTCGGEFNTTTNQYNDRIIVYAEQIEG